MTMDYGLRTMDYSLPAFDYQPLTRVVFGPRSLAKLGELVRELGGRRVLLVTDPGLEAAGHPQRAVSAITSAAWKSFCSTGSRRTRRRATWSRRWPLLNRTRSTSSSPWAAAPPWIVPRALIS